MDNNQNKPPVSLRAPPCAGHNNSSGGGTTTPTHDDPGATFLYCGRPYMTTIPPWTCALGGLRGSIGCWQRRKPQTEQRPNPDNMAGPSPTTRHSIFWSALSRPLMMTGRRWRKNFERTVRNGRVCPGSWTKRGQTHVFQAYFKGGV